MSVLPPGETNWNWPPRATASSPVEHAVMNRASAASAATTSRTRYPAGSE
ncbi:Uncharacterised protein [Mycobacteroides abscessus subsp. abscessus]|nr:Uncharacterised protein [Mycobacteroides abscessus subsp. abscessus]